MSNEKPIGVVGTGNGTFGPFTGSKVALIPKELAAQLSARDPQLYKLAVKIWASQKD